MNRSESIDLLVAALSKAQGSYKTLVPNTVVPGGKFANLQAILESVREALSSNGLAFYQNVELLDEGGGQQLLKTIIAHSSGQWISTMARIIAGASFRETFNCIEAYRRLNALLLLGIAPSDNDPLIKDDNGLEEHDRQILSALRNPDKPIAKKTEFVDTISNDQYGELMHELEGYDIITKQIQETYNISSLADLPKSEYYTTVGRIRKLKRTHEEFVKK